MTAPKFFVPTIKPEHMEEAYTTLAAGAGVSPLPHNERIYSIKYQQNGEDWTATVGDRLRGTRMKSVKKAGRRIERPVRLSDSATVLAIFRGPGPAGYRVVTNHGEPVPVGSEWGNPVLVGDSQVDPHDVILFS